MSQNGATVGEKTRLMGQTVAIPVGCGGKNCSKLTVYSSIQKLQPAIEVRGNIWVINVDLNTGKVKIHSHAQMKPCGSHFLPSRPKKVFLFLQVINKYRPDIPISSIHCNIERLVCLRKPVVLYTVH